jgi:hypothetical protein
MRRSAKLATALATLLAASGVAAAARPVFCAMTGTVASGSCCCDTGIPGAGVLPDCCSHADLAATPSISEAPSDLAAPVPSYTALLAPPARAPAWRGGPDVEVDATSPPLPLLHRALLI